MDIKNIFTALKNIFTRARPLAKTPPLGTMPDDVLIARMEIAQTARDQGYLFTATPDVMKSARGVAFEQKALFDGAGFSKRSPDGTLAILNIVHKDKSLIAVYRRVRVDGHSGIRQSQKTAPVADLFAAMKKPGFKFETFFDTLPQPPAPQTRAAKLSFD